MESYEFFGQFKDRYENAKESEAYRRLVCLSPYQEHLEEIRTLLLEIFPKNETDLVDFYMKSLKERNTALLNDYINGDKDKALLIINLSIKMVLLELERLINIIPKDEQQIDLLWKGIYLMDVYYIK
jgi:hypothetical protein